MSAPASADPAALRARRQPTLSEYDDLIRTLRSRPGRGGVRLSYEQAGMILDIIHELASRRYAMRNRP